MAGQGHKNDSRHNSAYTDAYTQPDPHRKNEPLEGLISVDGRIHYTATPDTTEEQNDLDGIQIESFLSTLADVALAVARRKEQLDS